MHCLIGVRKPFFAIHTYTGSLIFSIHVFTIKAFLLEELPWVSIKMSMNYIIKMRL